MKFVLGMGIGVLIAPVAWYCFMLLSLAGRGN